MTFEVLRMIFVCFIYNSRTKNNFLRLLKCICGKESIQNYLCNMVIYMLYKICIYDIKDTYHSTFVIT